MNTMSSEVSTSYIFQARNYTTMLSEYQKLESWRPLQGIRAVSVHQLLNARTSASDGNKFELADGIPITDVRPQSCMISSSHSRSYNGLQFTIVAQVLSVVVSPVNTQNESKTTTYTLQDGSGVDNQHTITCIHTHHLRSPRLEFRYGYARVVGTPKKTPRNTIRVAHITPIVDANEIYCHLLEVMVSAHTFAQGVPVGQSCIRGFDNNPDDYLQPPKRINTLSSPRKLIPPSPPSKVYENILQLPYQNHPPSLLFLLRSIQIPTTPIASILVQFWSTTKQALVVSRSWTLTGAMNTEFPPLHLPVRRMTTKCLRGRWQRNPNPLGPLKDLPSIARTPMIT